MDVTVDEIKLKGEEISEMKRLQDQLTLEIDKYKAQLRIFIHDRGLTTLSADNECFAVDLSLQTMKLKIAFEECDYFHKLSVIRSWRNNDLCLRSLQLISRAEEGMIRISPILQLSNKVKTLISLSSISKNLKNSIQRFEQLRDL
jgi:hypothetical protein